MNTLKKLLVVAMIASMVLGCFVFSTSAAKAKEYVDDGLVALYVGYNNSNGEQKLDAQGWMDLSGNENHMNIVDAMAAGEVSWTENALVINGATGTHIQLPDAVLAAIETGDYTIEIAGGELTWTATDYITLMSSNNDELSIFIRCGQGETYSAGSYSSRLDAFAGESYHDKPLLEFKHAEANGDSTRPVLGDAWSHINGKTIAVTSEISAFDGTLDFGDNVNQDGNILMYSNGDQVAKGEAQHKIDSDQVFLGHTAENRRWGGEIYSVRVYNRALTVEELAANAEADQFNFRSGNTIEAEGEGGDVDFESTVITGYTNDVIKLTQEANLIPATGSNAAAGIMTNHLYPFADEIEQGTGWEGAKIVLDPNSTAAPEFSIMLDEFIPRTDMDYLPGDKVQWLVAAVTVKGPFEGFNFETFAYNMSTQTENKYATTAENDVDATATGVQYLLFDAADLFAEDEVLYRIYVDALGMSAESEVILHEIRVFETAEAAFEFAGYEEETEPAKETEAETDAQTDAETDAQTEAQGTEAQGTDAGTDATEDEGCGSVVGFGAAAILAAAAAAVVLKKKD